MTTTCRILHLREPPKAWGVGHDFGTRGRGHPLCGANVDFYKEGNKGHH